MSLRTDLIDIIERADLAPDEQLDAMLDLLTERAERADWLEIRTQSTTTAIRRLIEEVRQSKFGG